MRTELPSPSEADTLYERTLRPNDLGILRRVRGSRYYRSGPKGAGGTEPVGYDLSEDELAALISDMRLTARVREESK
jgi:hypothetical protein